MMCSDCGICPPRSARASLCESCANQPHRVRARIGKQRFVAKHGQRRAHGHPEIVARVAAPLPVCGVSVRPLADLARQGFSREALYSIALRATG